jgi:hypothetical protein
MNGDGDGGGRVVEHFGDADQGQGLPRAQIGGQIYYAGIEAGGRSTMTSLASNQTQDVMLIEID